MQLFPPLPYTTLCLFGKNAKAWTRSWVSMEECMQPQHCMWKVVEDGKHHQQLVWWTHKNLNLLKVMFTIKRISLLFFHGSKQKLKINKNLPLDLKYITWIISYKKFKLFSKYMSKIGHFDYTNIKWDSFCSKLWQTFEGWKKII
jgi:hypothetical protein